MSRPAAAFAAGLRAAVIGASGGVGGALVSALRAAPDARVVAMSRRRPEGVDAADWRPIDITDEATIADAAKDLGPLDLVIVATGLLHADGIRPEKAWRDLDARALETLFRVNAIGPALVAKHFLPLLRRDRKAVFAALSARVGSIGDNRLGGWYGYRASKAALNMTIRGLSVELARRNDKAICVGLHPGTVATPLSAPFRANLSDNQLKSPEDAAARLLSVIDGLSPADSGGVFAWDGARIPD